MSRNVIDVHLHLDESVAGPAESAAEALDQALKSAGVSLGIVLHLAMQRWPVEEVSRALLTHKLRLSGFINVNPCDADAGEQLRRGVQELGFIGLKLHPRLQKYSIEDVRTAKLVKFAGELKVPVLIDAFPDGNWLMQKFNPLSFADLAKSCPLTRIIIAHMGGHHVLDFMMLAKRIPNIHFDTSYSLLYYAGSSVPQDMVYAMRSMRCERIFYGSDYPDRGVEETLVKSVEVLEAFGLKTAEVEKILHGNAREFFQDRF